MMPRVRNFWPIPDPCAGTQFQFERQRPTSQLISLCWPSSSLPTSPLACHLCATAVPDHACLHFCTSSTRPSSGLSTHASIASRLDLLWRGRLRSNPPRRRGASRSHAFAKPRFDGPSELRLCRFRRCSGALVGFLHDGSCCHPIRIL